MSATVSVQTPSFGVHKCSLSVEEMRKGIILTWCAGCKRTTKHRATVTFGRPIRKRVYGCVDAMYRRRIAVCLVCSHEYVMYHRCFSGNCEIKVKMK